jgi:hypothetical protein
VGHLKLKRRKYDVHHLLKIDINLTQMPAEV